MAVPFSCQTISLSCDHIGPGVVFANSLDGAIAFANHGPRASRATLTFGVLGNPGELRPDQALKAVLPISGIRKTGQKVRRPNYWWARPPSSEVKRSAYFEKIA